MKKTIASIISALACLLLLCSTAFATDIVATKKHVAADVNCADCHGTDKPTQMPPTEACLDCHKSGNGGYYYGRKVDAKGDGIRKAYNESGRVREMAVHDSHQGQVRCTVCHTVHKEPPKMHCNNCHRMDVKTP